MSSYSYVYFISNREGSIKIGKADNVLSRVSQLQTGSPTKLRLIGSIKCLDSAHAILTESTIHNLLSENRLKGEWFNVTEEKATSFLKLFKNISIVNNNFISKPSFIMVASGYGKNNMNYTKELLNMTSDEAFLFNTLMDNRDIPDFSKPYIKSNFSFVDNSLLSKADKKKVYKGYKKLKEKDLVIRTKRQTYIINPRLVISHDSLYEHELAEYLVYKNKE